MNSITETKVGKVVANNYRTARVFSAYGIDFCCKGGITIDEACRLNQVNREALLADLEKATHEPDDLNVKDLSPAELVDRIVNTHHKYVTEVLPTLLAYLDKLARVHGERHPELLQILKLFTEGAGALTSHMKKEELMLFPYIKAMQQAVEKGTDLPKPVFGDIANPIAMMEHEHDEEGNRFRTISELSGGYNCPPDGCQTYRVAYAMLKEFEDDLHQHIHLENNILFPQAQQMFQQLNQP